MTATIPTPRTPGGGHWCDRCRSCPSCRGGAVGGRNGGLPARYRPVIHPSGAIWAACTVCDAPGIVCPTLADIEATP